MILTPSRQILIPSLGSFIDRVRRNFAPMHAMAHLKKDPATGHLVKNAAGHLVNECGSIPCSDCSGATPRTLMVSVSGVTPACCSTGLFFRRAPLGTINGTWTLAQVSACTWWYDDSAIGTGTYAAADTTCTGSTSSTEFGTRIRVDVSGTTWRLQMQKYLPFMSLDWFFDGSLVTAWDCETGTISISNSLVACGAGGGGGTNLASGGTGVITPL